jgi:glycosyltransferase involved in cell wall biosynthesis
MKIAYWSTSSLEPRYEAVSQEVLQLAREFPGSWVFAVSPHFWARFSLRDRFAGSHTSLDPFLRLVIPLLERAFDVSHVYGRLTPWIFHKTLRSRPVIHTVTQDSASVVEEFLERAAAVVVQTETARERLLRLGVPAGKLHLRYPGIDLRRFRPAPAPAARPEGAARILFCTAPRSAEEMEARGVHLLLETAQMYPDLRLRFLYRTWRSGYTSLEATRKVILDKDIQNVDLTDGIVEDMADVYRRNDFSVIPFLTSDGGKECPNSALESLACGVPVLVSRACPLSRFVEENGCGVLFDPNPGSLRDAVSRGLAEWAQLSHAARRTAEKHLEPGRLFEFYAKLYEEVSRKTRPRAGHRIETAEPGSLRDDLPVGCGGKT